MIFINQVQSNEERREKYKKLIDNGINVQLARRMRDWTNSHIDLFLRSNKVNVDG